MEINLVNLIKLIIFLWSHLPCETKGGETEGGETDGGETEGGETRVKTK